MSNIKPKGDTKVVYKKLVEEYLQKGGKVTVLPPAVESDDHSNLKFWGEDKISSISGDAWSREVNRNLAFGKLDNK